MPAGPGADEFPAEFPDGFFARGDETDDADFYATARFVTHIDDGAIAAVGALYDELGVNGEVLDLMSSWVSHFPAAPAALTVLGMNADELAANRQARAWVVHDLNADASLPFADDTFDHATCCVSVDYLVRPVDVFRDVARVVRSGGLFDVHVLESTVPDQGDPGLAVLGERGAPADRRRLLRRGRRLRTRGHARMHDAPRRRPAVRGVGPRLLNDAIPERHSSCTTPFPSDTASERQIPGRKWILLFHPGDTPLIRSYARVGVMGDLLDAYQPIEAWDEMFDAAGDTRLDYRALYEHVQTMSKHDFDERCATRDRVFRDQGITFAHSGEERPFPLDLVPRVISATEWSLIERGVAQRVRALERFLDDVYGAGEIMRARVIPRRLVVTSSHFHRAACGGIAPPRGVRVHVAGIDLVRDAAGKMCVLEDNIRIPSGISYVVENRRAMTHVFPELFAAHRVQPVSDYPARLLQTLCAAAPRGVDDPRVVLLTPGVHNAAYFEHSFLARQMGVELVEGRDLVCRDNVLYMLTTSGEERIDVVYRRVDDEYLDPLHFLPTSMLGCAGIVNAARAGNVTIANFIGNGVADDKAVYPYVPAMIDFYLGEKPILSNVETFTLDDVDVRSWALDRVDQLVWKPADGSGGKGIVIGPHADADTLEGVRSAVEAAPRSWIAQVPVALSTAPTYVGSDMQPRHLDLRPFALNDGENVWVVPGGLTRVALHEGSLVVNSSQGGGSKDTWVLAPDGAEIEHEATGVAEGIECEPLARQPFDVSTGVSEQGAQQQ